MSADESFSSSSTISYHSFHDNESASINTSSSATSSLSGIYVLHPEESLFTDSNLDDSLDITDELWQSQSGIYDISVDISIEVPREESFHKADMLRATVYTICGELFYKNEQWRSISSLVAHQLGRSLNPSSSHWSQVEDKGFRYVGTTRIAGHMVAVDHDKLPIIYDSMTFHDNICATNAKLNYFVDVFLSPAVAAAEKFYRWHGFRSNVDTCSYKKKHMDDIWKRQEAEKQTVYNHHLAWATVYNVLEGYRRNISKQNKFYEEYGFSF